MPGRESQSAYSNMRGLSVPGPIERLSAQRTALAAGGASEGASALFPRSTHSAAFLTEAHKSLEDN